MGFITSDHAKHKTNSVYFVVNYIKLRTIEVYFVTCIYYVKQKTGCNIITLYVYSSRIDNSHTKVYINIQILKIVD